MTRAIPLHPFAAGYEAVAGAYAAPNEANQGCLAPDPAAWPSTVVAGVTYVGKPCSRPPRPSRAVPRRIDVPMGTFQLTVNSSNRWVRATSVNDRAWPGVRDRHDVPLQRAPARAPVGSRCPTELGRSAPATAATTATTSRRSDAIQARGHLARGGAARQRDPRPAGSGMNRLVARALRRLHRERRGIQPSRAHGDDLRHGCAEHRRRLVLRRDDGSVHRGPRGDRQHARRRRSA